MAAKINIPISGSQVAGLQNPNLPLTEKQRLYVHHLVHNKLNQMSAARHAGYSSPEAASSNLMKNPKIQKAIAEARAEYAQATGMTRQRVIDGFSDAIDIARLKGDAIAMVAGWREIGKMCGLYEAQKTELKVSVNGQVLLTRLNSMTDEELLKLAEETPHVLEGEYEVVDKQTE